MIYFIGNNLLSYKGIENSTLEKCQKYLLQQTRIGVDIETSRRFKKGTYPEDVYKPGLDPKVSRIVMLQIGTLSKRFVIDTRAFSPEILSSFFKPIFENKNIEKVGHNLKFEGKFFLEHFNSRLINVWDTMLVEKVLYNGFRHGYSLAALMDRYLGKKSVTSLNLFNSIEKDHSFDFKVTRLLNQSMLVGSRISEEQAIYQVEQELLKTNYVDKSTRLGFLKIGNSPFTQTQVEYGDEDIVAPLKIQEKQKEHHHFPAVGVYLENKTTQVLAEMEWRGVPFNKIKWLEAYKEARELKMKRFNLLNSYIVNHIPQFTHAVDLFTNQPTCAIQWSSSSQVIKLFRYLGICPMEKSKSTGKISYTVGAKTLFRELPNNYKGNFFQSKDVEIIDTDTLMLQYLLFKKAEQLCTTFGKDWLKYVHPITHKVHPNFNQYMISSRLSSSNPNLQQIPNAKSYRSPFEAPKGWKWLSSDYAAQEIRIAGDVHNIQNMIDFFVIGNETWGEDFHSFSATQMQRKLLKDNEYLVPPKEINGDKNPEFTKVHGKQRNDSKQLTFKLNYGGSPYTVSMDLGISEEEAEKYIANFFSGFPGMLESFDKKRKLAVKRGWIELDTYTNKRYYFPDFKRMKELILEAYSLTKYEQGERIPQEEKSRLKAETNWSVLWKEYMILKGKLERRALNLPIQGAAAAMTKLALILMYNKRWEEGIQDDFLVLLPVHDETNNIATDELAERAALITSEAMVEAGNYICKKIPMEAGTEIGQYWIH